MMDIITGILMIVFYLFAIAVMATMLIYSISNIIEDKKFHKRLDEEHKKFIEQLDKLGK